MSTFSIEEYHIVYYVDDKGRESVKDYIHKTSQKEQTKIYYFLEFLRENKGNLDEPYTRHVTGKIRELRVDFAHNRHRIFYCAVIGRRIVLLHAFLKKTPKTPQKEKERAIYCHHDFLRKIT